jgi:integrase
MRRGELLALCWPDVDLACGAITVRSGKTPAAARTVYMLPALRDELAEYRASLSAEPAEIVFSTATGKALTVDSLRRGIIDTAVEHANKQLAKEGVEPLPHLTPHSLRRTNASLLFAIGEPPPYVMAQLGHVNASETLGIYAKEMLRRDGEPA